MALTSGVDSCQDGSALAAPGAALGAVTQPVLLTVSERLAALPVLLGVVELLQRCAHEPRRWKLRRCEMKRGKVYLEYSLPGVGGGHFRQNPFEEEGRSALPGPPSVGPNESYL